MLQNNFRSLELLDFLGSFEAGANSGIAPLLLPKNQLAAAFNSTERGSYMRPRPVIRKITLDDDGDALLQEAFLQGKYQGGTYYKPDEGDESIRAAIAGRLFQLTPVDTEATVTELTIPGDANPASQPQAWLWQSEKWTIWNDGVSLPVFTDETTSVRSNYNAPIKFDDTTATNFTIPAIAASFSVDFTSVAGLLVGDIVTFAGRGTAQVLTIAGVMVTFNNLTLAPNGQTVAAGKVVWWVHIGTQLPPGRMGTYGMGRNWICLVDGKQFVASDLVGGSSGTQAEDFRDAVLEITENLFLAGGGNFTVPGSIGDIRAMRFAATLDASLGQGPLQVFTPTSAFSVNAPVDRLTWQNLQNPILTQSLIGNGAMGQEATINANSDIIFRSPVGICSLILGRREFSTWGNVPQSREVETQLSKDSNDLLTYASAIVFDNRLLMTTGSVLSQRGVYFKGIVPLNFDPLSSMRGKLPSIYDSTFWTGINVFQLFTGMFGGIERAFALTYNKIENKIELYEILKSSSIEVLDNSDKRIVWGGESASLFRYPDSSDLSRTLKRLLDAEIYVDQIPPDSIVDFFFWYKPDQWPCWVPWFQWRECSGSGNFQFRPRMGLGEPVGNVCDPTNNRPLREAYTFQIKWMIEGTCRLLGGRIKSVTVPEGEFSQPNCNPICVEPITPPRVVRPIPTTVRAILDESGAAILEEGGGAILEE